MRAVVERKFGAGGPFHPETPGSYRRTARVRAIAAPHDGRFVACVATMATYLHERYGRFPATLSPMLAFLYLQAHHLDTDHYDAHFAPGAYLPTHRDHLRRWHGAR